MLKFVVLSLLAWGVSARPYGAPYGSASYGQPQAYAPQPQKVQLSYGASASFGSGPVRNSGLGASMALNSGYQSRQGSAGLNAQNHYGLLAARQSQQFEPVITGAIQQIGRTVEYRTIPNVEQPIQAQVIEIEPSDAPLHLHFKTKSSTLSLSQSHTPAEAQEVQTSQTQDEPQRLITEVQKPVIQEVRETIIPYRQVTQEINPVIESLHSVVTRGEGQRAQYAGSQYGAATQQYGQPAPAPVQSTYAQPARQQSTYAAQPARQTQSSYQSSYVAKPAVATASLQTNYPAEQSPSTAADSDASAAEY